MAIWDTFKNLLGAGLPDPDLCLYRNDDVTPAQRVGICSTLIARGDPAMRSRFFNGRAIAYRDLDDVAAAKTDYDRAIALDPEYATGLHNRAVLAYECDEYEASLADADRVIALEPDRARGYVDRFDAFCGLGDHEAALRAIEHALAVEEPSDYRLYAKGRLLVEMGRYTEAILLLDAAIERDPNYRNAIERRLTAYAMLGDLDAQRRDVERLFALDPDDADAHGSLAHIYAVIDPERALGHCDKALALEPDAAAIFDTRAAIRERLGDLAAARADQDRAVQLWPHEPTFRANRAVQCIVNGDFACAEADIDAGLELDSGRHDLLIPKAHLAMVRGELAKAEGLLAEVLSRGDDASALCIEGLVRLKAQDDARACALFDDILSRRFGSRSEIRGVRLRWTALQGRAITRSRQGDHAGAEEDTSAARTLRPDVVAIFERWGLLEGTDAGPPPNDACR